MLDLSRERRPIIIAGIAVILVLFGFLFFRSSGTVETDPALARIEKLERKKDVPGLTQAVNDPDPRVACRALAGLGRVAGPSASATMGQAMTDSRPIVRQTAVLVAGDYGMHDLLGQAVDVLKNDHSPLVRSAAAKCLGKLDDWDGVEPLIAAMNDDDRFVRVAASRSAQEILGFRFNYSPEAPSAMREAQIAQIKKRLPAAKKMFDQYKSHPPKELKSP